MDFPAIVFSGEASASLKDRGESILIRVGCVWLSQLGVEVTQSAEPVIVLGESFEESVVGEDIWAREEVGEDARAMVDASA